MLPSPNYRETLFRVQNTDRDRTDHYLDDEALANDPRQAKIHAFETAFVRSLIDKLPSGAVVADVPCGNGRMSRWAIQRGDLHVLGMDVSHTMLKSFRNRIGDEPNYWAVQADVTALPLATDSVDFVINMRLMHHIPEHDLRVQMMRELARVSRGPIVSSFWSTRSWRFVRRRFRGKSIRGFPISPIEFERCCQEAGLTLTTLLPVRPWFEEQCLALCTPA